MVQKSSIHALLIMALGMGQIFFNVSVSQGQTKITFEEYQKQCLDKIKNSGIKGQLVQDICNCTIAAFKKRHNLEEFNRVVQKSKTDKAVAKQLADVGEKCFEKYLYE